MSTDLHIHLADPPPDKTFEFRFTGTRVNSLGVIETHVARRTGTSERNARIKLYDEFEHISILSVTEVQSET
jgi:hypothetical protein